MLHRFLGNPVPWHGHYYCAWALAVLVVVQVVLLRLFKPDVSAGLALCVVSVLSYLIKAHQNVIVVANVIFLFAWGVRLVLKGVPVARQECNEPTQVYIVFSQTAWIWLLSAPTVFAVSMNKDDFYDIWPWVGLVMCALALLADSFETGVVDGRLCRNPYVFCSLCLSWGLFLTIPFAWTLVFPLAFSCVLIFAPGGAVWVEAKRRAKVMRDPDVREYQRVTSPFIPMPPGVYAMFPRTFKKLCCLDF